MLSAIALLCASEARAADDFLDAFFPSASQLDRVCLGTGGSTFVCDDLSSDVLPSAGIALGDLDSDGRLDAVIANDGVENRVCLGDGSGAFSCSKLNTDAFPSLGVALGLVNGDNRLDAVFANGGNARRNDRVCFGDSNGSFSSCRNVSPDAFTGAGVAFADMNEDNDLDAVFANTSNQNNRICLGDGNGGFACANVSTDAFSSIDVAIGDVDNDLNLDAVFANGSNRNNRVCFGDGAGGFKSCQNVSGDAFSSTAVALGSLDDDKNLDAVFANSGTVDRICLGDGDGGFTCSDVSPDAFASRDVALGDVNGDGELDAVFAIFEQRNRVCIGDGRGSFTCADVSTSSFRSTAVALGQLNPPTPVPLPDTDGDGLSDDTDNCISAHNPLQQDFDMDGRGNPCDIDNDNDGLPDAVESLNGLDPLDPSDAGADPDGDGFSTLDELLAGSDPLVAASTPLSLGDTFDQGDLVGIWHSYDYFDNASGANDPGWNICSPEFDASGTIVGGGCVDADGVPFALNGSGTLDPDGTFVPAGAWVQDFETSYYHLDSGKSLLAGVATSDRSGDGFPLLDLTVREGSGYRQDDLTGTWHRYRYADREGGVSSPSWTRGRVDFDATGTITFSQVFDSAAPGVPVAPWVGSAMLEADGEVVTAGDWMRNHAAFSFSMDAGKSAVAGVATRNQSGNVLQDHELWIKQGSGYVQSDLAGTWYVYGFTDTSSGSQIPAWTRQTLVVDATGTVVDGSGVDSDGMLQPHLGTLTLAPDGQVMLGGALAANVLFQELRMDAGRTVTGGVLSVDQGGTPFERLVVAVRSGSARAEILRPVPGSVLPGASATWEWTDNGLLVTNWQLKIGTNPGAANINDSGILPAATRSRTVSGLPTAGETVFVRLLYREGGLWMMSDVQYTASGGPGPPPPSSGTSGATVSSAPDLSLWGLMAMVFGIWSVLAIDTRRRAMGDSSVDPPARANTIRLACGLAGVVGLLLVPDLFPELQVLLEPGLALLTQTVEHLVAYMGVPVTRAGTVLAHPDGFGYRIDYLCAGIQPAALMAATLLMVRATWTQRTIGILVVLVGVEAFNVGRLVHLYLLGVHWPEAFAVAHEILWNVAAMVAGLAYLGTWLLLTDRRRSSHLVAHGATK